MNKFFLIITCVFVMFTDFAMKYSIAKSLVTDSVVKLLDIKVIHNYSSFLGFLSSISPFIRHLLLSVLGGYFLFAMIYLILIIDYKNFAWTKSALILTTVGAAGNILERIFLGRVTDYFSLELVSPRVYMNLSDLLLFFGLFIFFISQIIEGKRFAFDNCKRTINLLISPLQKLIALYTFFFSFLLSIVPLIMVITMIDEETLKTEGVFIALSFLMITLCNSIILTIIILKLTHRSAGAIYAIERSLPKLLSLELNEIKLREKDFHKSFSEKISKLITSRLN